MRHARGILFGLLLVSSPASANGHGGGGGGGGSPEDPNLDCLLWAPLDAGSDGGLDGGLSDGGVSDGGFQVGAICLEHAKVFGCSALAGLGAPASLLALLALARRARR